MPDSIDGPNLNMPPPPIDGLSEPKPMRESHQFEDFTVRKNPEKDEKGKDKKSDENKKDPDQDRYEKEENVEPPAVHPVALRPKKEGLLSDEPGNVIDVKI